MSTDNIGTAENPSDLYRRATAYLTELGYLPPEQPGEVGTLWRKPEPRDSRNYTVGVYYEMRPDGMDWETVSDRIAWLENIPADVVRARCGTDAEREAWLARRVEQLNDAIRTVMPGQATIIIDRPQRWLQQIEVTEWAAIQARIAQRMATRDDDAGSNP